MTTLPGIAGDIENVIGLELTVVLLKAKGGSQIDIPVRPDGTVIAKIIGVPATAKLIKEFGVGKVNLPCAGFRGRDAIRLAKKSEAIDLLKSGLSVNKVALRCDLNQRTVWEYKREITDDRQTDFGF